MVFGSYWVVLEPNFLEEVGGEQLPPQLYNPGLFEAMERDFEGIQSRVMLRRSQAKAIWRQRIFLRRRRRWTISGSSRHPFCVTLSLHGSRDLGEHDQIILVAIWYFSDVLLSFRTKIKKPPPQIKGPET
jgi:hypothetical protein